MFTLLDCGSRLWPRFSAQTLSLSLRRPSEMASAKTLIAAGVLAVPCVDAFVAPGTQSTQGVTLRGSALVSVQSESSFGAYSALAAASAGAAVLSFAGAKKPVARKNVVCNFSKESQIGAMDPVGFFGPLDFCKDEATFKDLRAKEIKHGLLAMMDALGNVDSEPCAIAWLRGCAKGCDRSNCGQRSDGLHLGDCNHRLA